MLEDLFKNCAFQDAFSCNESEISSTIAKILQKQIYNFSSEIDNIIGRILNKMSGLTVFMQTWEKLPLDKIHFDFSLEYNGHNPLVEIFRDIDCLVCQWGWNYDKIVPCSRCNEWVDCGYNKVNGKFICAHCIVKGENVEEIKARTFDVAPADKNWYKQYDQICYNCSEICNKVGIGISEAGRIDTLCCLCRSDEKEEPTDLCHDCGKRYNV